MNEIIEVTKDPEALAISTTKTNIVNRVDDIIVKDDATKTLANEILVEVATTLKSVEKRRKFFVEPLNKHVSEINEFFRQISEPLKIANNELRVKIQDYMAIERERLEQARREAEAKEREQIQKAREAQIAAEIARNAGMERAAKTLERKAEEATTKGENENANAVALSIARVPTTIQASGGKSYVSKHWTWKLENAELVPSKFLMVNEKAIDLAVKQGARNPMIPGVNIYEDERLNVRTK